jgi:hypothetical protein
MSVQSDVGALNDGRIDRIYYFLKERDLLYFSVILTVGILLRLLWVVIIPCFPVSDFSYYYQVATTIGQGDGVTAGGKAVVFAPMGYPIILGLFFMLVHSNNLLGAQLLNVFMSTLTMIASFMIFRRLVPEDKRVANFAITLLALYPQYIAYNNIVGTEVVFTLLFSAIILLQLTKIRNEIKIPLLGILLAVASLVKPFFIAYPVVIGIIEWIKLRDKRQALVTTGLVALTMIIAIAPWTYRNYLNFKMFIPVSSNSGYVLYVNNNNVNDYGGWLPIESIPKTREFKKALAEYGYSDKKEGTPEGGKVTSEPNIDRLLRGEAIRWITTHPFRFATLGFIRIYNAFFTGGSDIRDWAMAGAFPNRGPMLNRLINLFIASSTWMTLFLSINGFIYFFFNFKPVLSAIIRRDEVIKERYYVPVLNLVFFIALFFVFEGQPRYGYPLFMLFVFNAANILLIIRDHYKNNEERTVIIKEKN